MGSIIFYVILVALFAVYASIQGYKQALYYHLNVRLTDEITTNLHGLYFGEAVFVGLLISVLTCSFLLAGTTLLGLGLIFPFFHDGYYYATRNKLDSSIYFKKWKAFGDGNAKMDFTWNQRLAMFIVGIVLLAATCYLLTTL